MKSNWQFHPSATASPELVSGEALSHQTKLLEVASDFSLVWNRER